MEVYPRRRVPIPSERLTLLRRHRHGDAALRDDDGGVRAGARRGVLPATTAARCSPRASSSTHSPVVSPGTSLRTTTARWAERTGFATCFSPGFCFADRCSWCLRFSTRWPSRTGPPQRFRSAQSASSSSSGRSSPSRSPSSAASRAKTPRRSSTRPAGRPSIPARSAPVVSPRHPADVHGGLPPFPAPSTSSCTTYSRPCGVTRCTPSTASSSSCSSSSSS